MMSSTVEYRMINNGESRWKYILLFACMKNQIIDI